MVKKSNGGAVVATQDAPGTDVALPDDIVGRLAQYAVKAQKAETVGGTFFGTRAAQLTFNKLPIPNNEMEVIVLASLFERTFYPTAFNPDAFESPLCFGFAVDGYDEMLPHANATEQQAEACIKCPHAAWQVMPDGKSRVPCKQIRRLSCMTIPTDAAGVANATIGYLRVPVTSTKHWAAYVQTLPQGLPPFAVTTKIKLHPDAKNQVRYEFTMVRRITDPDTLAALSDRHDKEQEAMAFGYERRVVPIAPAPAPAEQPAARKF